MPFPIVIFHSICVDFLLLFNKRIVVDNFRPASLFECNGKLTSPVNDRPCLKNIFNLLSAFLFIINETLAKVKEYALFNTCRLNCLGVVQANDYTN